MSFNFKILLEISPFRHYEISIGDKMMNEKERRAASKAFGDIHDYLYKNKAKDWAVQTDKPYCFVKLDPHLMTLTICRWGKTKRPPLTDSRLWYRIHTAGYKMENDVTTMVMELVKYWDDFIFDAINSDSCPPILPNMKHMSLKSDNIFQMRA